MSGAYADVGAGAKPPVAGIGFFVWRTKSEQRETGPLDLTGRPEQLRQGSKADTELWGQQFAPLCLSRRLAQFAMGRKPYSVIESTEY